MPGPTDDVTIRQPPQTSAVDAVLDSAPDGEAAEAAQSFLRLKRGKHDAQIAARDMALISRSLADREEQRRMALDAARARAMTEVRVFVKPPTAGQTLVSLRMKATDTVKTLTTAAESRCGLTAGTARLVWGGQVVSLCDCVSQYATSPLQPFRLLPAVSTASKCRIDALAQPVRPSREGPACDACATGVPVPAAIAPSPRLVKLSTPRAAIETTEQCATGEGSRRRRTRPCTPRVHALAQPTARKTVSQRAVATSSGHNQSPRLQPLDADVRQADAATRDVCTDADESVALSFVHEAVALAKALMAEGRRHDLSTEQQHICYTDAVDSLVQAVDVATETRVLHTEELEQLARMLELAQKHVAALH